MQPSDAINALILAGWTEALIAAEVGTSQATINRIKHGSRPAYDTGRALIDLADRHCKAA